MNEPDEIAPVVFFDKDFRPLTDIEEETNLYDFRPKPVSANTPEAAAPKVSSAQESVDFSDLPNEEITETPVSVEKDSGPSKESEAGMQASSSKTSTGKTEQTA